MDDDDLLRIADEMAADQMPRSAAWLRRIADPAEEARWRRGEVRKCFAIGTVVGVLLALAVRVWWEVLTR